MTITLSLDKGNKVETNDSSKKGDTEMPNNEDLKLNKMDTKETTTTKDINRTIKIIVLLSFITILPAIGITFNFIPGLVGWVGFILILCVNLFFIIRLVNIYIRKR